MAKKKEVQTAQKPNVNLSASTPEALEQKCIAMAMDLAAQRLADGTASSQIIVEFIKRGSTKEALEKEIMSEQKKLMKAKTEAIQSQQHMEEVYAKAIAAMQRYRGDRSDKDEIV